MRAPEAVLDNVFEFVNGHVRSTFSLSMSLPPWLDRIWLILIAVSFCVMVPIWLILSVERYGLVFVIGCIILALAIRWRPR